MIDKVSCSLRKLTTFDKYFLRKVLFNVAVLPHENAIQDAFNFGWASVCS